MFRLLYTLSENFKGQMLCRFCDPVFLSSPRYFINCSRTKFQAIIVNVCFHAKFLPECFLLEHSFDFTSRVTFSRLIFCLFELCAFRN